MTTTRSKKFSKIVEMLDAHDRGDLTEQGLASGLALHAGLCWQRQNRDVLTGTWAQSGAFAAYAGGEGGQVSLFRVAPGGTLVPAARAEVPESAWRELASQIRG